MKFGLIINGEKRLTTSSFAVVNPSTGEQFADCPDCSRELLQQAVESALAASKKWRFDLSARRRALVARADAIEENITALAEILVREQGKPLEAARGEVMTAAHWFRHTSTLAWEKEVLQDDEALLVELYRKPLGVVAAITPWNFPIALAVWKIAPALLAGNTMVLKPSPYTPLSSLKLGEVLLGVLPPGVFNVVSGGNELGQWLCEHPDVRKISFTGSVATGKRIMASAAPDLKRLTLELGGNDPAIVLKDNDPKAIAEKLFWAAFRNSGQICVAVKRLYVEEDIYDTVKNEIVEIAKSVKVADGFDKGSQLGPLNNQAQFDRITDLIDDARKRGAKIETGGERIGNAGYFYAPTIVSEIEDRAPIVSEEQFGPALPILPFKSVEDVIDRANATHFGLGGSIWTSDVDRGRELAQHLDCGTGWVNQHLNLSPSVPFGGTKWSGIGYENGHWGLDEFTELQVINSSRQ